MIGILVILDQGKPVMSSLAMIGSDITILDYAFDAGSEWGRDQGGMGIEAEASLQLW
jgi:hypothetical protein